VRNLCRVGLLTIVTKELLKYKLNLVGVQEVRRERGGTEPAGEYFFYGKGNENYALVSFLYVRESYQQLRELSLLMIGCHA
jgi:hypothetical protein